MRQAGILAIWHDIVPEREAEVLDWYNREHHFERLGVLGFLDVRRYRAVEGKPLLFIRYETTDPAVLSSPAYIERLNAPTPWTLRSQPHFRSNSRTVCVKTRSRGGAEGGFAVPMRLTVGVEDGGVPSDLEVEHLLDLAISLPGVVGIEAWRADRDRSTITTREKQIRKAEDEYVDLVLVAHATDYSVADKVRSMLLAHLPEAAGQCCQSGIYQLSFSARSHNSD